MIREAAREGDDVAPYWHTAVLVLLILAVAITGAILGMSKSASTRSVMPQGEWLPYVSAIVVQWSLVAYVCRLGRSRNALAPLLGVVGQDLRRLSLDVLLGASGWVLIEGCEFAWARVFGSARPPSIQALLPSSELARVLWVAFAVSAGFCEEVVYRGYLRVQLTAFTRSASVGVLLQAMLFGIAHLDQGAAQAARISFYGAGLGMLARFRRSLVPGIFCHIAIDLASGLVHS